MIHFNCSVLAGKKMIFVLGILLLSRGCFAWRLDQSNIPITKEKVIKMRKSQKDYCHHLVPLPVHQML